MDDQEKKEFTQRPLRTTERTEKGETGRTEKAKADPSSRPPSRFALGEQALLRMTVRVIFGGSFGLLRMAKSEEGRVCGVGS
jgi:hypothetical protein